MEQREILNQIRKRRKRRTRAKTFGTAQSPRLSVFRSNRYVYTQLIDDKKGETLISASTRELAKSEKRRAKSENKMELAKNGKWKAESGNKIQQAEQLGKLIAKKAIEKGIKKAVFDRSWYKYHGRIKAVAEGAKKQGLQL